MRNFPKLAAVLAMVVGGSALANMIFTAARGRNLNSACGPAQAPPDTPRAVPGCQPIQHLEMVDPSVTPEDGVTRYEHDRTQGPTCAMAASAATIYRNYFAPVGDQIGQTEQRQLDGLTDVGAELSARLGRPSLTSGSGATAMRSARARA